MRKTVTIEQMRRKAWAIITFKNETGYSDGFATVEASEAYIADAMGEAISYISGREIAGHRWHYVDVDFYDSPDGDYEQDLQYYEQEGYINIEQQITRRRINK